MSSAVRLPYYFPEEHRSHKPMGAGPASWSTSTRYSAAVVAVALATAVRWALRSIIQDEAPFLILYPIALAIAFTMGVGPGLLCGILGGIAAEVLFISRHGEHNYLDASLVARLALLCLGTGLVGWLGTVMTRARQRARDEADVARAAEASLRERAHFARKIIESSLNGRYIYDLDAGRHVYTNPEYEHITGYSSAALEAITSEQFRALFHPDDQSLVADHLEQMRRAADGEIVEFEYRFKTADGRWIWCLSRDTVFNRHPDGRVREFIGAFLDITHRKTAEAALYQQQELLRLITDAVPVLISYIGRDYHYRLANVAYKQWFGLDSAQVIGHHVREVLGEAIWEKVQPYMRRVLEGEQVFFEAELPFRAAGLQWIRAVYTPDRDPSGAVRGFVVLAHDIGQARRDRIAIQRTAERFGLLADVSSQLLAAAEPQRIVEDLCRKVMRHLDCDAFFNYLLDQHGGRLHLNACAGIPEEMIRKIEWLDSGVAVCGCVAREGTRIVAENVDCSADPRTELVRGFGIRAYCCHPLLAQGRVIGTLSFGSRSKAVFSEDDLSLMKAVTDQVAIAMQRMALLEEAQAQARSAQAASAAKDQFIANLSHELRTPLTPVFAAVSTLKDDPRVPEVVREDLAMVHRNVELETRLIDDLLDVVKIARGKLEAHRRSVDLADIIREAARICSLDLDAKGQTLTIRTPGEPYMLLGDAARLQQVFWNLIKNSIKFTPEKGRISITARVDSTTRGAAGKRTPDPRLLVQITDNGVGIDPELLPRLFSPFEQGERAVTRRFGGLGLGLAICRAVVEMHDGRITAQSDGPGKGATFTVELPLKPALAARESVPGPQGQPCAAHSSPLRILLVEDHADTARLMRRLLVGQGHDVTTAPSVAGAIEAATSDQFDLLISDLGLPDGSGHDLMAALVSRGRIIPGICLSGYGTPEDIQKSRAAGFREHMVKPVSFDALKAALIRMANDGE